MPPKKVPPLRGQTKSASPELDLIRTLADILNETGLSEIELEQKGSRVRVSRTVTAAATVQQHAPVHHAPAPSQALSAPVAKVPDSDHAGTVKSPMVGTIYMASAPGNPNFIEIGSQVKQGQTLLIIEAMKTMNQIPSPVSGKVIRIHVDNGDPVEYGAALVTIE
ncbi:MAG: acetyl-CoA carboxylase biotin carboxyl carrier protein [Hyphomicrobiales bacterium]|jgi:acetyl-CoA carboxylase biotin carboxyl carrier protein|nr:acetyl-CoA carboxylase biotin carboxyl carrier protein [Hyphomicrobiales bacterium]